MTIINKRFERVSEKFVMRKNLIPAETELFHYTSKESADIILSSKSLRLSRYDCSSDDKEFQYGLSIIGEILKEFSKKSEYLKWHFAKFQSFFDNEKINPTMVFYMVCFCKSNKNRYLKRNYANNGKGSCLSIRLTFEEDLEYLLYPVTYSKRFFERRVHKTLLKYENYLRENEDEIYQSNEFAGEFFIMLIRDLMLLASIFKRNKYHSEKEIRLINFQKNNSDNYIYFSLENSVVNQVNF